MNDDPLKIALMDFSFETATSSSSSSPSAAAGSSSSAYDFVKGFITGQLALLALLLLIVRLLFFRSAGAIITPTTVKLDSRIFPEGRKLRKLLPRKSASPAGSSGHDALLLERLFQLNPQLLKGEALKQGSSEVLISDESARWLTFLLAKLAVDPLREQLNARSEDIGKLLQSRIMEKISVSSKYATLDELNFKVLSMGPNYPQIDAYQLVYDTQREACAFRVRCSWQDVFKMELESSLRLGGLVCLPFVLGAEVRHLRFTAQLQFIAGQNEQDDDDEEAFVEIFCLPDDAFLLELDVGSLVGHRTKLKDLPKITAGIVEGIKKVLTETLIYPRSVKIPLKLLSALNFSASASASDNVDCRSESCPEAEAEAEAVVVEGEADVVEAESDAELFADAGSEALDQTDDESLPFLSLSAVNSLGRTCSTINGEQESAM